jgi:hypothetical protein
MKHFLLGLALLCSVITVPLGADAQALLEDSFVDPNVTTDYTLEENTGFVPCSGRSCSSCDFVVMINTIIKWLIGMAFLFFAILATAAGFKLVTSGGNQSARESAKSSFQNAFIGLIIILAAWLIIDTLMRTLLKNSGNDMDGIGPWSQVRCVDQAVPKVTAGYFEGDAEAVSGTDTVKGAGPGVTPTGSLVSYGGYQFDSAVVDKIRHIDNSFDLRLSGGYRTTERNRQVNGSPTSYHLSGRAADFVGSATEMRRAADWAKNNGAKEILIHNAGSGTHLHVAW